MTKPRRRAANYCVHCGGPHEDWDHVPPKGIIPPERRSDVIKVPSCKKCNSGASKDDEYFRNILVLRKDLEGHPAIQDLLVTVRRSLARPDHRGTPMALINRLEQVP